MTGSFCAKLNVVFNLEKGIGQWQRSDFVQNRRSRSCGRSTRSWVRARTCSRRVHFRIEHAFGQRLLQVVQQAIGLECRLRVSSRQQFVQNLVRETAFGSHTSFLSRVAYSSQTKNPYTFGVRYNHVRPHSSLKDLTSIEFRTRYDSINPGAILK